MTVAETSSIEEGQPDASEKRVVPLELFFDLVFVFAVTQVTVLMSHHPTWEGLGQGLLVLAAVWWCWGAYAWLTNYIAADEGLERLLMFVVMGAMLIAAGLVDDGTLRAALWIVGLGIDYAGPYVYGVSGFRISPGHFAERFSLIVIIALGESIVAIGAGVTGDLDGGVLLAAVFGLIVSCSMWWAYFDVVAVVSERRFRRMPADRRLRIARDSYSYLHLPMIAGIVLVALGVKKSIAHVDE